MYIGHLSNRDRTSCQCVNSAVRAIVPLEAMSRLSNDTDSLIFTWTNVALGLENHRIRINSVSVWYGVHLLGPWFWSVHPWLLSWKFRISCVISHLVLRAQRPVRDDFPWVYAPCCPNLNSINQHHHQTLPFVDRLLYGRRKSIQLR